MVVHNTTCAAPYICECVSKRIGKKYLRLITYFSLERVISDTQFQAYALTNGAYMNVIIAAVPCHNTIRVFSYVNYVKGLTP